AWAEGIARAGRYNVPQKGRAPVMKRIAILAAALFAASVDCGSPADETARLDLPGLHNVFRVTGRLYSGSSPEDDAGFRSLQRLGIRTVITVDGARPDVERARRFGLRYVHLPIGYDGVPEARAYQLARAVRDLPGPV